MNFPVNQVTFHMKRFAPHSSFSPLDFTSSMIDELSLKRMIVHKGRTVDFSQSSYAFIAIPRQRMPTAPGRS
jgi:hypothetical protein